MSEFNDREHILNRRQWSGETCCLKKRPKPGEKIDVMGYSAFGIITSNRFPIDIWGYDGRLVAQYSTIDELLEAGWTVD